MPTDFLHRPEQSTCTYLVLIEKQERQLESSASVASVSCIALVGRGKLLFSSIAFFFSIKKMQQINVTTV
jgi:hypothetical protein